MADKVAIKPSPDSRGSDSPGAQGDSDAGSSLYPVQSMDSVMSTDTKDSPQNSDSTPAPKPDKPKPHVCNTCGRCFARLEHLKRHERSHTKEKPFQCPECTRCFARRDLLLRHQQKLHLNTTTASKPRGGRRESTSSTVSASKVRKNSMASNGSAPITARPRANTISTLDQGTLGMLAAGNHSINDPSQMNNQQNHGMDLSRASQLMGGHSRQSNPHGLPRIATAGLGNVEHGLRTAPPGNGGFTFEGGFGGGNTVNPAQLHLDDSLGSPLSPFHPRHMSLSENAILEDDENMDWMRGFNAQMAFGGANEHAIGESSPSAMSNGSMNGVMSDMAHFDVSQVGMQGLNSPWPTGTMNPQSATQPNFPIDNMDGFSMNFDLPPETVSPKNMSSQSAFQPPPTSMPGSNSYNQYHHPMSLSSDGNSISSMSAGGSSARHSSVTSTSTESITDMTRQALIMSLSQPSVFGNNHRKYSQPTVSSPLSPRDNNTNKSHGASLPSTYDLQRFVSAFIQYFHPHFPFLHIPTLSFDTPAYTSNLKTTPATSGYGHSGIVGGGGCLILAMAAIGALYEFDRTASKELFESAKKMIQLYLEERRKADVNASNAHSPQSPEPAPANTPLWLVQAMLLNVVYGHLCGEKTINEIANTHCAALMGLAKAASLHRRTAEGSGQDRFYSNGREFAGDVSMGDDGEQHEPFNNNTEEQSQWHQWIVEEERKRTLFAIFHLSSILVSAYNHPPALMNSEIQLDLPCEEDLWSAESSRQWASKGGAQIAEHSSMPFATALSTLLNASYNQQNPGMSYSQPFGSGVPLQNVPSSSLKLSTFGCLVLIDALHNYIWETRQRHSGRRWTAQETDSMHAHIEPALRAWQAAWASNPTHSLQRPNPFGMGPLSADSIPLLDLAYVRLFVNLGTSKEALWQRDFDAMADELARGDDIVQHADDSEPSVEGNNSSSGLNGMNGAALATHGGTGEQNLVEDGDANGNQHRPASSKRERHLRKAAFYAADSMSMSDKLGVTFADFTSRELPVQSALCTFDCAQVLSEWISTVQERVGRYLGVLGRDSIDYSQVPAIMLLEDEDVRLLEKITDIIFKAEQKLTLEATSMGASAALTQMASLPSAMAGLGYGAKILTITAQVLQRAAVWPLSSLMVSALEVQSAHMTERANNSVSQQE